MKILIFVIVLCTTYIAVSDAQDFQHWADKPTTDDQPFPINQPDYVGDNRHVQDMIEQPYNRGNIRSPENMKRPYAEQQRERDRMIYQNPEDYRDPQNNKNVNNYHRQFGDREQQKNPNYREPFDYRRSPDNKMLPRQDAPPDYRMLPDNREPLNNRELQDKRKHSHFIEPPEKRKQINDVPPNRNLINTSGPPNRRETPDMKNEIGNRAINNIRGYLHDRGQLNNKGIPEDRATFLDHRQPLNDVSSNSWDQSGTRPLPASKDSLKYKGLPDNRNPLIDEGLPDTKNEDSRTDKVVLDNVNPSNVTNKDYNIKKIDLKTALEQIMKESKGENNQIYIIGNMPTENGKENIKVAKLIQSSASEANISSSNLQNPNFESTDSAANTITTSTFSPYLQVTAVTPVS